MRLGGRRHEHGDAARPAHAAQRPASATQRDGAAAAVERAADGRADEQRQRQPGGAQQPDGRGPCRATAAKTCRAPRRLANVGRPRSVPAGHDGWRPVRAAGEAVHGPSREEAIRRGGSPAGRGHDGRRQPAAPSTRTRPPSFVAARAARAAGHARPCRGARRPRACSRRRLVGVRGRRRSATDGGLVVDRAPRRPAGRRRAPTSTTTRSAGCGPSSRSPPGARARSSGSSPGRSRSAWRSCREGVPASTAFDVAVRAVRVHLRAVHRAVAEALPGCPQVVFARRAGLTALLRPGFPLPPDAAIDLVSGALAAVEAAAMVGVHHCGDGDWARHPRHRSRRSCRCRCVPSWSSVAGYLGAVPRRRRLDRLGCGAHRSARSAPAPTATGASWPSCGASWCRPAATRCGCASRHHHAGLRARRCTARTRPSGCCAPGPTRSAERVRAQAVGARRLADRRASTGAGESPRPLPRTR